MHDQILKARACREMKLKHLACLIGLVALQSCDAAPEAPARPEKAYPAATAASIQDANRDFNSPLDLRATHDGYDCVQPGPDMAPEAYDRDNYLKRLAKPGRYIDAECLSAVFSADQLAAWTQKGDPVARYVGLVNTYDTTPKACAGYDTVMAELDAAGKARFRNPQSGKDMSRVPEAYVSAGVLEKVCGRGNGEAFFRKAEAEGLPRS